MCGMTRFYNHEERVHSLIITSSVEFCVAFALFSLFPRGPLVFDVRCYGAPVGTDPVGTDPVGVTVGLLDLMTVFL